MPCKLECFGWASYKRFRALLARLAFRLPKPARNRLKQQKVYLKRSDIRKNDAQIESSDFGDVQPIIPRLRWGLLPVQDDLLDCDAQRRLKRWLQR